MSRKWMRRSLIALAMLGGLALKGQAFLNESEDVQRLNANPSPSPAQSNIDNYINQDEQLNVDPHDGLVKVLRTDQKLLINDYVTELIPIRNVAPREIRGVMRQITGMEGGRAEVIRDKKTGENFVQVIAPEFMIPYLRETVAALDVKYLLESWDGSADVYLKMQHRDATSVDRIAENYGGSEGFTTIDTTNNAVYRTDEAYRIEQYKNAVELVDIPTNQVLLDVKVYELGRRNDLKLGLDYVNWKNGPGRNLWSFAVAGYSAEQRAKGLTSIFDPFIDARVEVGGDDKHLVLDTEASETYRAVNYLLTSNYVDFLQAKGLARVLNSQQLLVRSSQTGVITADEQLVAIVNNENEIDTVVPDRSPIGILRTNEGTLFADLNGNGRIDANEALSDADETTKTTVSRPGRVEIEDWSRRVNYRRAGVAGVSLTVTPYVGLETMEMVIDLEIGEQTGVAPSGLPIIDTRTMSTTVRLLDGQPYVVAGVKRDQDVKNSAKAPFLGDIPVIGYLFGGETNLRRESDVIITITPYFYIPTQMRVLKPERVATIERIVAGQEPLALPQGKLGFDQWLMN